MELNFRTNKTIYEKVGTGVFFGGIEQIHHNPIYCTFTDWVVKIEESFLFITRNNETEKKIQLEYKSEFVYKIMKTKIIINSNDDFLKFIKESVEDNKHYFHTIEEILTKIYETVKPLKP